MSNIITKTFDASKKIIRSIFLGSPNLFTSSDLNRQFEALKYQLDQLDDKVGIRSDIEFRCVHSASTLSVYYKYRYIEVKGCRFEGTGVEQLVQINLTSSTSAAYLDLNADTKTLTYADDFSHDTVGAKFTDGTSQPSANQLVYNGNRITLTHAHDTKLVATIAKFEMSTTGKLIISSNVVKESLSMKRNEEVSDYDNSAGGNIEDGDSYDRAISILNNRFCNDIAPDFVELSVAKQNTSSIPLTASFKIRNGVMYFRGLSGNIIASGDSKLDSQIIKLLEFPSAIKSKLLKHYTDVIKPTGGENLRDTLGNYAYYFTIGLTAVHNYYPITTENPHGDNKYIGDIMLALKVDTEKSEFSDIFVAFIMYGNLLLSNLPLKNTAFKLGHRYQLVNIPFMGAF